MIRDFAKRRGLSFRSPQKTNRKGRYQSLPANGYVKMTAMVVLVALVAGGVTFFWFGRQITAILYELSVANTAREQLAAQHESLLARQNTLMGRENIEAQAAKLNLFPPTPEQIRRP